MEFKVAVIGSRSFSNYNFMESKLNKLHKQKPITKIISGGANGADTLAEVWANLNDIPLEIYEAKWDDLSYPDAIIKINKFGKQYDSKAGIRRNYDIVYNADMVLVFWDQQSSGTRNSIELVKKMNKLCKVWIYQGDTIIGYFNPLTDSSIQPLNEE